MQNKELAEMHTVEVDRRCFAGGTAHRPARNRLYYDVMPSIARIFRNLVFLVLAAVTSAGCRGEHRPRILVLGIDGANWEIMTPLMTAGRLPNMARFMGEGTWGPLRSFQPYLSPRIWTSIATGKAPDNHGILAWVKSQDNSASLYYSGDRDGHALWNIFSDQGLSVALVNWLATYPPEVVRGVVVSDHALSGESQARVDLGALFATAQGESFDAESAIASPEQAIFPRAWNERVLHPRHAKARLTSVANPFVEGRPLPDLFEQARLPSFFERDQELVSVALEIDRTVAPDLAMILLQGVDRVSHYLWACRDDQAKYPDYFAPSEEELRNCSEILEEYYVYTDQLIGRILSRYTDKDLVMVVSDHGFETVFADQRTGSHISVEAADGILLARGPRIEKGRLLERGEVSVYDIAPTILAWSGRPTALDMDGQVAPFLIPDDKTPAPEPIETYSINPIVRVGESTSGGEEVLIDQLQALGYVD